MQGWVKETGQRIVILCEGCDAAGKGGTIKRFMEHLNPRGARVVALEKPSDEAQGMWYFQHYIKQTPTQAKSSCSTVPGITGPASPPGQIRLHGSARDSAARRTWTLVQANDPDRHSTRWNPCD